MTAGRLGREPAAGSDACPAASLLAGCQEAAGHWGGGWRNICGCRTTASITRGCCWRQHRGPPLSAWCGQRLQSLPHLCLRLRLLSPPASPGHGPHFNPQGIPFCSGRGVSPTEPPQPVRTSPRSSTHSKEGANGRHAPCQPSVGGDGRHPARLVAFSTAGDARGAWLQPSFEQLPRSVLNRSSRVARFLSELLQSPPRNPRILAWKGIIES